MIEFDSEHPMAFQQYIDTLKTPGKIIGGRPDIEGVILGKVFGISLKVYEFAPLLRSRLGFMFKEGYLDMQPEYKLEGAKSTIEVAVYGKHFVPIYS